MKSGYSMYFFGKITVKSIGANPVVLSKNDLLAGFPSLSIYSSKAHLRSDHYDLIDDVISHTQGKL